MLVPSGVVHRAATRLHPSPGVVHGVADGPCRQAHGSRRRRVDSPYAGASPPQRQLRPLPYPSVHQNLVRDPLDGAPSAGHLDTGIQEVAEGLVARRGDVVAASLGCGGPVEGERRNVADVDRWIRRPGSPGPRMVPPLAARLSHHGRRPTYSPGPRMTPGRKITDRRSPERSDYHPGGELQHGSRRRRKLPATLASSACRGRGRRRDDGRRTSAVIAATW